MGLFLSMSYFLIRFVAGRGSFLSSNPCFTMAITYRVPKQPHTLRVLRAYWKMTSFQYVKDALHRQNRQNKLWMAYPITSHLPTFTLCKPGIGLPTPIFQILVKNVKKKKTQEEPGQIRSIFICKFRSRTHLFSICTLHDKVLHRAHFSCLVVALFN